MSDLLTVGGFPVRVTPQNRDSEESFGDFAPAYNGVQRSDKSGDVRTLELTTDPMSLTDALIFREILRTPGRIECAGDILGGTFDCHALARSQQRISHDLAMVTFALRQSDPLTPTLLFSFDGDAFGPYTHIRTGAVGKYTDSDGVLQDAAADTLRREYLWLDGVYDLAPDTAAGLFEAARENLVTSDDISAWSVSGTPVVTGSVSDPAGGTGAFTVADNDGAAGEYVIRNVTFTGGSGLTRGVVFVIRKNTEASTQPLTFGIHDASVGWRIQLNVPVGNWVDGEPAVTASIGTYLGKRYLGNGFWAIYGQATSVNSANTNRVLIMPTNNSAETGSVDVFRVNVYDVATPSYSIVDASETRNADTHVQDWLHAPQAMTVYVKLLEWGTLATTGGYVFHVGADTTADPYFSIYSTGSFYQAVHSPVAASLSTLAVAPTYGQIVELCAQVDQNGAVLLFQSLDGGALATGTQGSDQGFAAAWSDDIANIGGTGLVPQGMSPIIQVRAVADVYSMAQMRRFAGARLWQRAA